MKENLYAGISNLQHLKMNCTEMPDHAWTISPRMVLENSVAKYEKFREHQKKLLKKQV